MAETITVNGVDRSGVIPRKDVEWAESAYLGETASGRLIVHDDAGTISIPSHKTITVEQSSSTPSRIFTGFARRKGIRRGETYTAGAGREIAIQTADLNDLLRRYMIRIVGSETGKRPDETVGQRLTWLLASPFLSTLVADYGACTYPSTVGLDGVDLRGRYPGDVLADMAKAVRFNYYVRYKAGESLYELVFRDDNAQTADTCTLSISNVASDINGTTVFPPFQETELDVDGEHIYSGVRAGYARGNVYRERAATATAFVARDGVTDNAETRTAATAARDGDTFLNESKDEEQLLPVTLRLRANKVGLIRPGQRISTRMSHMAVEGWDPARYAQILRMRVTQPLDTDNDYDVAMDLSPQETGPVAAAIRQSAFNFFSFAGAVQHLPNPPVIGNTLLVAMSCRSNSNGNTRLQAPLTEADQPRWGAGAWTNVTVADSGDTWVPRAGTSEHHSVAFYWKVVDSISQDGSYGNGGYMNVGVWELSGVNMATATLVRANNQAANTTYDLGTLGTIATGELGFMITHSVPDDSLPIPAVTPAAGWVTDWYRGSYPIWYATTYPVAWLGHAIGDGSTVDPSIVHGAPSRPFCGLALKVPAA